MEYKGGGMYIYIKWSKIDRVEVCHDRHEPCYVYTLYIYIKEEEYKGGVTMI